MPSSFQCSFVSSRLNKSIGRNPDGGRDTRGNNCISHGSELQLFVSNRARRGIGVVCSLPLNPARLLESIGHLRDPCSI